MSLLSKRTALQPKPAAQESSTFFAAASPKSKDEKPAEPLPNSPQVTPKDEPKKPARTFFDTGRGYIDPLTELSTHRSGRALMSDEERAARKAAEEQRARRGLENLQAAMNRTKLIGK
ncbi:hypothetical protein [Paraburkholderia fungorum]|uniref:Uncharacterized protein n=1 Tax=Paraburkholderia fungorum TaxID=134537 RepID=A0AAW3V1D6_9BURK|nr:hypothetical protein [Paraburkholderia fungorum]MBB4515833.1 hypothetical protein [Paraburkholderia fungorum]MBB6203751.1 hypothetical protein [Paraburkholderia fungorum]